MLSLIQTLFLFLVITSFSHAAEASHAENPGQFWNEPPSLSDVVISQYPELLVDYFVLGNWSEASEMLYAYALGMYLVHSKPRLFHVIHNNEFDLPSYSFNFNLSRFIALLEAGFIPETGLSPLFPLLKEKRGKLAKFCEFLFDLKKLKREVEARKEFAKVEFGADIEGKDVLVSLNSIRDILVQSSKSHYSAVAIDIAILRHLSLASDYPLYQPIVLLSTSGRLCTCLVSLSLLPQISFIMSKDFEKFFNLLAFKPVYLPDEVEKHLVVLLALLPQCPLRMRINDIVDRTLVGWFVRERPGTEAIDLLSHPNITLTGPTFLHRIDQYVALRDAGLLKIHVNGCPGNVNFNLDARTMNPYGILGLYKGTIYQNRGAVEFECPITLSQYYVDFFGDGCPGKMDVLVASVNPLDEELLELFGKFLLGEKMEETDLRKIIYVSMAYGVLVMQAPRITVVDLFKI